MEIFNGFDFNIFNESIEDEFPRVKPAEITVLWDQVLGKGGFCSVHEVSAVNCHLTDDEVSSEDQSNNAFGFQNKKYMNEHYKRDGHTRYAIKKLSNSNYEQGDEHFVHGIIDLALETRLLAVLRHKHIIKMRAIADVPDASSPDYFIMMDRLSETLSSRIVQTWKKENNKLFAKKKKKIEHLVIRIGVALDICSALEFLHHKNIVYRDLKPENVGFDIRDDLKVFDFGLCSELQRKDLVIGSDPATYKLTRECGTFRYMAPEVEMGLPYNQTADVYSFAILVSYICNLELPFSSFNNFQIRNNVHKGKKVRPKINKLYPDRLKKTIRLMWDADLSKRPSMTQVRSALNESWLHLIDDHFGGATNGGILDISNRTELSLRDDTDKLETLKPNTPYTEQTLRTMESRPRSGTSTASCDEQMPPVQTVRV